MGSGTVSETSGDSLGSKSETGDWHFICFASNFDFHWKSPWTTRTRTWNSNGYWGFTNGRDSWDCHWNARRLETWNAWDDWNWNETSTRNESSKRKTNCWKSRTSWRLASGWQTTHYSCNRNFLCHFERRNWGPRRSKRRHWRETDGSNWMNLNCWELNQYFLMNLSSKECKRKWKAWKSLMCMKKFQ